MTEDEMVGWHHQLNGHGTTNWFQIRKEYVKAGPITSWEIDGETVSDFIFGGLQNHCRW